jgi:hypothetical protein
VMRDNPYGAQMRPEIDAGEYIVTKRGTFLTSGLSRDQILYNLENYGVGPEEIMITGSAAEARLQGAKPSLSVITEPMTADEDLLDSDRLFESVEVASDPEGVSDAAMVDFLKEQSEEKKVSDRRNRGYRSLGMAYDMLTQEPEPMQLREYSLYRNVRAPDSLSRLGIGSLAKGFT